MTEGGGRSANLATGERGYTGVMARRPSKARASDGVATERP
jgi:hypothetical protein